MKPSDDRPAIAFADGLAQRLARWARAQGADAAMAATLARVGHALALAQADGHVCLPLSELVDDTAATGGPDAAGGPPGDPLGGQSGSTRGGTKRPADSAGPGADLHVLRATLRASPLVGRHDAPITTPLVLDADDRLYLARNFDHERRLAARLAQAADAPPMPIAPAAAACLRVLFDGPQPGAPPGTPAQPDWQQVAAALALRRRLVIISGGPGTGKTTTVLRLLACLLAGEPGCRIALAAPTGKAAARLGESLRERAAALAPALPAAVRNAMPTEASTVHRLLGVRPGPERFVHQAANPLPLDALVVDEASMLDLALARRLLDAVPPHARIVLLGDKDQLAAVESGAVFAELSADPTLSGATRDALAPLCGVAPEALTAPTPAHPSPLHDSTVWFMRTHRFRAGSGIARLAADINAGRAQDALALLREAGMAGAGGDLQWLDDPGAVPSAEVWQAMTDGLAPYLDAVRRHPHDPAAVARAWSGFIVLTALRAGPRGLHAVNERLERHAREWLGLPAGAGTGASPWYAGRPVMVLRNDPVLRLFNGDVGFVLPDARGVQGPQGALQAWFPDASSASAPDGGWRAVPPLRLPPHQTAFAMTVHKAQGSEFDRVLMLLPAQAGRVLTRELLYTGLTRAREGVTLAGAAEVICVGISAPTWRRSGLLARSGQVARLQATNISTG